MSERPRRGDPNGPNMAGLRTPSSAGMVSVPLSTRSLAPDSHTREGKMGEETIHVLIADDHELVRNGLKAALRSRPEFNVVGEARDGTEAVKEAIRLRPDLVVMDIRMPK